MKRLSVLALLAAFACYPDAESPVGLDQEELTPRLQYSILDGMDVGGDPGFRWLPPILKVGKGKTKKGKGGGPWYEGEFDPDFLPFVTVEVCEWAMDQCVGEPIRRFTSQGRRRERLKISGKRHDRYYHVDWKTKRDRLDPGRDYRIRVLVGALELGHADVDVVRKSKEGRGVDQSEFVVLRAGRNLPIKFVITDALEHASVVGSEGGAVPLEGGEVTLDFPPDVLADDTPITVRKIEDDAELPPGPLPVGGLVFDLGPDGIVFDHPVTLTITFDPSTLPPGVDPADLKIHKLVDGVYVPLAGVVDLENHTVSAQVDGFSVFAVLDAPVPAAPSGLSALSFAPGSVVLEWVDESDNETRFEIKQFGSVVRTVGADVTTASFDGLDPGESIHWTVAACNDSGCSPDSDVAGKTADGSDAPVPAAPSGLSALPLPVPGSVLLLWVDESDNETYFQIKRDGVVDRTVGANVTTTTFSGLPIGQSFIWTVAACNASGCSADTPVADGSGDG